MKFNQWTLGLAAIGVVSLASAAKAEEKANLQTALSQTTISGYVDTSAQWNFNASDGVLPPYRFGGVGKADGFNLDVVQVRIDKALDESEWAAGYRVDLWFGPDANTLNTSSTLGATGDFAIRQAYVALRTPIGTGLDWKVGVFDSILGYESVESGNNPNYTRSYGHTLEPQTQTGVLTTYRFNDMISASAGVANTAMMNNINSRSDNALAWMGSIALTAPEDMGFLAGSTLYAGIENGFGGPKTATTPAPGTTTENTTSYYVGATIATPVTGLRLGTAFDLLDVHHQSGETWTVAGYASYQASEKMSLHLRGEYLKDRGQQEWFGLNSDKTMAITGTIQYDLWKNVISRLEVRWDHSLDGTDEFGGTTGATPPNPDLKNAWMLGANIIYKF